MERSLGPPDVERPNPHDPVASRGEVRSDSPGGAGGPAGMGGSRRGVCFSFVLMKVSFLRSGMGTLDEVHESPRAG